VFVVGDGAVRAGRAFGELGGFIERDRVEVDRVEVDRRP